MVSSGDDVFVWLGKCPLWEVTLTWWEEVEMCSLHKCIEHCGIWVHFLTGKQFYCLFEFELLNISLLIDSFPSYPHQSLHGSVYSRVLFPPNIPNQSFFQNARDSDPINCTEHVYTGKYKQWPPLLCWRNLEKYPHPLYSKYCAFTWTSEGKNCLCSLKLC